MFKTIEKYDKYKDSGIEWIGEIPDSWNMAKLSWCSQFINGYAFDSTQMDMDKKIPVVRIGDIQNGKVDYDNCLKVMQNDNLKSYIVKLKDIVIAMSGATTGKIAIIDRTNLAYINQRVGIIRSQNNQFIKYCLENESFIKYIDLLSSGSAQPNISMGDILHFKIPYISIKEQEAIAGYLDRKCGAIDETIEKQKSVIEKLKEYKQSIITQAVTKGLDKSAPMKDSGIEWIGQIPQHWEICKLKNYAQICNGQDYKLVENEDGDVPVIGSGGEFTRTKEYLYVGESVLLGRKGTINRPIYINGKFWTVDTMYYTKLKEVTYGKYFYYLCRTINFDYYQYGSTLPSMTQRDLNSIQFPFVPIGEQKQIADFLDKKCSEIDKTIEDKEKLIEKLVEYKKSLIYECVTGKRKVVA